MSADELRAKADGVLLAVTAARPDEPFLRAAGDVAAAWLAEHPADDGEDTSADWLESVGLPSRPGFGVPFTELTSLWDSSSGWHLFYHNGEGDGYMPGVDINGPMVIANCPTRGHVRRLAAAFGVELKS